MNKRLEQRCNLLTQQLQNQRVGPEPMNVSHRELSSPEETNNSKMSIDSKNSMSIDSNDFNWGEDSVQKRHQKDRQIKTVSVFTKENHKKDVTEKQGYLFKQGGHVKVKLFL